MILQSLLLLPLLSLVNGEGIYPTDHWKYSTKLTTSTFDETVKQNVDSGKTLLVRWIASEG